MKRASIIQGITLCILFLAALTLASSVDAPKFDDPRCEQLRKEFEKAVTRTDKAIKNEDFNGAQDAIGYMRGVDKAMNLFCGEALLVGK